MELSGSAEAATSRDSGTLPSERRHLVLALYAGDYEAADRRRLAGESDRYRHHTYALDCLYSLIEQGVAVTVVQVHSDEAFDIEHEGGPRFIGLGDLTAPEAGRWMRSFIETENVSHAMVRFPDVHMLEAVAGSSAKGAAVLADSFGGRLSRLRKRRATRRLGRALHALELVSNHQINASRDLASTFDIPATEVVPWDWPLDLLETAVGNAAGRRRPRQLHIVYVGSIGRTKGIFDLVRAMQVLRDRHGLAPTLDIAGGGDLERLQREVDRSGLQSKVRVLGRVGGDAVLGLMAAATFVCVPSRHSYPEGLPLTLYEAMAVGTPLIASDHPMFTGVVRDDVNAFVFRAGRIRSLAATIDRAWRDADGYQRVSATASATYAETQGPVLWGDLVRRWVSQNPLDLDALRVLSLASLDD